MSKKVVVQPFEPSRAPSRDNQGGIPRENLFMDKNRHPTGEAGNQPRARCAYGELAAPISWATFTRNQPRSAALIKEKGYLSMGNLSAQVESCNRGTRPKMK